jgi:hypothetical protein
MSDKQKREALAEMLALQVEAQQKGWKVPRHPDPFGMDAWVRYWKDCKAYEQDPSRGRPVVPHRSGGATAPRR